MNSFRIQLLRFLNALFIVVLSLVIIGAYIYQYTARQNPCPLCELQRLSMMVLAFGPMLNLKFGFRTSHYSVSILGALFGSAVSLRQICLHICPGFTTFGLPVFGYELYTWAFIVFFSSLFAVAVLLLSHKDEDKRAPESLNLFEKISMLLVFLIALANAFTVFLTCGVKFCPDSM